MKQISKGRKNLRRQRHPTRLATVAAFFSVAASAFGQSDSERLQKLEQAVQLLQKQNAQLQEEVNRLKKDPFAAATDRPPEGKAAVEPRTATKTAVYVTAGAAESKLTLGGFIQAQGEAGAPRAFDGRFGSGAVDNRFLLRRSRINLSGDFAEQFDFKIEGEFGQTDSAITVRDPATGRTLASNATRTSFSATDIFANWHELPEANVKIGQYKAPFGLEQLTSDTKLFTIERSLVTSALTPERQIGAMVWGKPLANLLPAEKDTLSYSLGVFNGNGRNVNVNDNSEGMYVGRAELYRSVGKLFGQEVKVKAGANGLYSRDEAGTNISPAGNLRVNSDGSLSASNLASPGERTAWGTDVSLSIGPFDLVGEYLHERVRSRGAPQLFNDFTAEGYYVQGSYFLLPKRLQTIVKWESFDPGQLADDDIRSITAGVNYYIRGDDLKLLGDYIHTWSDFRHAHLTLGDDEFDQFLLRLQVMF